MTATRSAISATTPKSWVMNNTPMPRSRWRRFTRARMRAWVVTSSAVVGSSAMSSAGSSARAMAIIARWRWPPESWWGYIAPRRSGSGSSTAAMTSCARAARARGRMAAWADSTSSIWRPMRITGLSAVMGSWKIIAMREPRSARRRPGVARVSSSPSSSTRPASMASCPCGNRPMTAWAATVLPEPDSPTRHRVSSAPTVRAMSSTARSRSAPGGRRTVRPSMARTGVTVPSGARVWGRACRASRRRGR